jgi:hypothetical protein
MLTIDGNVSAISSHDTAAEEEEKAEALGSPSFLVPVHPIQTRTD